MRGGGYSLRFSNRGLPRSARPLLWILAISAVALAGAILIRSGGLDRAIGTAVSSWRGLLLFLLGGALSLTVLLVPGGRRDPEAEERTLAALERRVAESCRREIEQCAEARSDAVARILRDWMRERSVK